VLALLTWGIGSVVKNSARVTKILKWLPDLNRKKIVPANVDKYADDIRKANGDRDLKANSINRQVGEIEIPQSAKKYEQEIGSTKKKELETEAKQELDKDPNQIEKDSEDYKNKLAALATAKVITEGADLLGLPISDLRMELEFLKGLKGVKDFEFEGSAGVYKVYMIGSKFLVDGKYTESGEGKYQILGKSKNGNVLQAGDSSFGWQHIVKGHVDGQGSNTMFPKNMPISKIKELILEGSDMVATKTQGSDRFRVTAKFKPAKYGISEMEIWVNSAKGNIIETAYPTKGSGVWTYTNN